MDAKVEDITGEVPLCVDLDGTLLRSDILIESFLSLLRINPVYLFLVPFWLLQGKAYCKHRIAGLAEIDPGGLPYHERFLAYLRDQETAGRTIVLVTATNAKYADQIAAHLGLFDKVLASDEKINLAGANKLERLLREFGENGFDYAANARPDLEIWPYAREAILVNPEPGIQARAQSLATVTSVFEDRQKGYMQYLKALRLHQWVKNLLIFIPLMAAHKIGQLDLVFSSFLAFVAFSLCASSVYILNDLLDLEADRRHPTKRNRPLAAGTIPVRHGVFMIPVLLSGAFITAVFLPPLFQGTLALYYALTLAYSLKLKQAALLDVLLLAGLYTIRLLAGAAAIAISLSFWLLAFSMFFFYSLALVKRYSELLLLQREGDNRSMARGYRAVDLEGLAQSGITSGFVAVLVLALYINSEKVTMLYSYPEAIWLLCPLLLYWINRVWLLARRDELHEDPVVFAIQDRCSHLLGILMLAILWLAV